jgi:hypothetical protein
MHMSSEYQQREGRLTKTIEQQTSRLPSGGYMTAAFASMAVSATLKIAGRDEAALFVGQWAAPFLIMGMYNKLVKLLGSEGEHVRDVA